MKKFLVITVLAIFLALPVGATTANFTADANITVSAVTFGVSTADMLIMNGSAAESWNYSSGAFTVTNPGSFQVGSADSAVKSIKVKNSSNVTIACADNTTAGTNYVTLPTASGTYTIEPSTTTSCNSLCATQTGAATYYQSNGTYTLPTCGVATCNSPYALSATSASTSTTCNPPSIAGGGGGGGGGSSSNQTTATNTTATQAATTTQTTTYTTTSTAGTADEQVKNIVAEAATIAGRNVASVLAAVGAMQDAKAEAAAESKYTNKLISGLKKNVTAEERISITNFINYGTPTTKILGAGERAGVISSYKSAFGKVPTTAAEWSDAIKIANGRWPSETSATAESKAVAEFKNVYKRSPNMKQANDNAAVTVISYGLRPTARNTNSEKAAIKSFKAIYGHAPVSALAWDIVRAIAYSGAKR